MAYWGCTPQAGWGCIFMTGSTKMGLHFQAFFNGVTHLWNFGSKKILTSRNRNISGKKFVAIFSHNNLVLPKNDYCTPVREQLKKLKTPLSFQGAAWILTSDLSQNTCYRHRNSSKYSHLPNCWNRLSKNFFATFQICLYIG